jgi:GTP cyclohydrolase IB
MAVNCKARGNATDAAFIRSAMNAPQRVGLPDIQALVDARDVAIDEVGIKGVRYPMLVAGPGGPQPTIATFAMTVALPASSKGTHMSRFIELLEAHVGPMDVDAFRALVEGMLERLDARAGTVEMAFPYFRRKAAPVSGIQSLLDYEAVWRGSVAADGSYALRMQVRVPATSLCPCSKEISAYGAHNQRSHITIEAEADGMSLDELIAVGEASASCEVYGLLKRADEKYVTEMAYDNPKFVEDLVRDVAVALRREPRVRGYRVEAENFESIHNHSAFARVCG